jgi:hypothetical protein
MQYNLTDLLQRRGIAPDHCSVSIQHTKIRWCHKTYDIRLYYVENEYIRMTIQLFYDTTEKYNIQNAQKVLSATGL